MSGPFGTSRYVRRVIDDELDDLMPWLPAVLLDGPKGVGKTETALQRAATVYRLDRDPDRSLIAADVSVVGEGMAPVLIDEWHRLPSVWDAVRRAVDEDSSGGRFLLTGSAPQSGTHSGAGRIVTRRMRPLCLFERGRTVPTVSFQALTVGSPERLVGSTSFALGDYVDEIVAGGFPGMVGLPDRAMAAQLDTYVERIVDRDVLELGHAVRRPAALLGWLRAYAAASATTTTLEAVRDAASAGSGVTPARSTTVAYAEMLTALRILDPVPAWLPSSNHLRQVGAAPKHHLVDPALAARLLRRSRAQLRGGDDPAYRFTDRPLLGRLFESFVALSLRTYAQRVSATVSHLRTRQGRQEVDFVVEVDDGRVLAVEAKLGDSVIDRDVQHLLWLRERLGDRLVDAIVVNTGPAAYRRRDGVGVVPLALLGP